MPSAPKPLKIYPLIFAVDETTPIENACQENGLEPEEVLNQLKLLERTQ